jgi:hypothetical protein
VGQCNVLSTHINALTQEEKEELIRDFTDQKGGLNKIQRPSATGHLQDALGIVHNMQKLVSLPQVVSQMIGLNDRVGIEGFFCIIRSC